MPTTPRKSYAYRVIPSDGPVNRPMYMGTIHATSMDDAVRRIAKRDKLELRERGSCLRPCDSALIRSAHWYLGDKQMSILVWASPEHYLKGA